jgi:salicylate hydroxylase
MLSNPITAPLMSAPESKAWLGPYTAVLGYTVASDSRYNFLISVPRPNPDVPLASWNEPGDLAVMRGLVDGWCEEVQALASLVQEGECAVWALGEVLAVPSYVSESGRVVLIGDAAHAILPHAGQGGGMAIEDAASLAEFLGCMTSRDDLGRTMSAWSEFRQTRVEHLREIARSNADALTFPDGPSQVARDAKWAAITQEQQAQAAELGVEGLKEKVIREKVAPDPTAKTLVEPGGAMWVNGYDVCEESRKFCREHLRNQRQAIST